MEAPVETTSEFLRSVKSAFQFLESEYGFRPAHAEQVPLATFPKGRAPIDVQHSTSMRDRVVTVEYTVEPLSVRITNDPRGETQVTVHRRDANGELHLDLWHILRFYQAPEVREGWLYEWGATGLKEVIRSLASGLERYGGPLLRNEIQAWRAVGEWRNAGNG